MLLQKIPTTRPPPPPQRVLPSSKAPIVGHCIFCLRQLTPVIDATSTTRTLNSRNKSTEYEKNQMRTVPKADLQPSLVSTFNKLLPCLHKKWSTNRSNHTNPCLERISGEPSNASGQNGGNQNGEGSSLPKEFPHLPAMCIFCGDTFLELDRIIALLTARLQDLREVINSSKTNGNHSWRWEQFEKDLRNNPSLTESSVLKTLEFYKGLGVMETEEEDECTESLDDNTKLENEDQPAETFVKVEIKLEANSTGSPANDDDETVEHDPSRPPTPVDTFGNDLPQNSEKITSTTKTTQQARAPVKRKRGPYKVKPRKKLKPKRKSRSKPHTAKTKCDFCPLSLLISEMREHLQEHIHEDYIVLCPNPDCDRAYPSPFKLAGHLRTSKICRKLIKPECSCGPSISEKKIRCKCEYDFGNCETCGFQTKNSKALQSHLNATHEIATEKNYFCPIAGCEEGFTLKQSVHCHLHGYSHRYSVINPTVQKCLECGTSMKTEDMTSHLETLHDIKEVVTCKECKFSFPSWETLLEHLRTHRRDIKCLTCYLCDDGVQYAFHKSLQYHFFQKHQVGTLIFCDQCNKSFLNRKELKMHSTLKHSDNQALIMISLKRRKKRNLVVGNYRCSVDGCGRSYMNWARLKIHKKRIHSSESVSCRYKCEVDGCGKSYASLFSLTAHEEKVHLGIVKEKETIMCEECGEYFAGARALSIHKLIHTGERPYQCNYCGQRFRHTSVLKTHVESHKKRGDSFKPNGPMKHVRKRVRREPFVKD